MTRRELLHVTAAGIFSRGFASAATPGLKIAGLKVFTVLVNTRSWVIFELKTKNGLTGLGDATHSASEPDLAVRVAKQLLEVIEGRTPFEIERLRQAGYPLVTAASAREKRPHAVALSGLEQCMWDLQGKALGLPCYELFGGKLRDRIRNYANINRATRGANRTPEGFAANARKGMEAGFDAFKMAAFDHLKRGEPNALKFAAETLRGMQFIEAVRDTIGPDRDLLLDGHSRFNVNQALALAKNLERFNLFWLEEVCRETADLAMVNRAAKMPTAGGESLFGTVEFYPYIKAGAVDIVMPDMKFCGGMSELKKIGVIAEAAGQKISPHGPASPLGNMAAAHVCATMPNFQILELAHGEVPWRAETVEPAEELDGGYLTVTDRPGIGYELSPKRWKQI